MRHLVFVIVSGGLCAAWLLTGWYGAGMLLLGWASVWSMAELATAMHRSDAARLLEQTESRYTCPGCHGSFSYGSEWWVEHVPYCRPCAAVEMARLYGNNEVA